jgi:exonuclease SbcD
MRLIHTADWHLCDRLGRIDRTDDLNERVRRVAHLCREHTVDLLLIAGDLFSEQATPDQMTEALRRLHDAFRPFFDDGGTIVAVTGNHDRDGRINLIRAGMSLVAPPVPQGGRLAPGRLYLLNGCFHGTLEPRPGDAVQLVLVPYPFASRYGLSATEYRTREEENRLLHGRVAGWLRGLPERQGFDPTLPTVLAAHLHVRGSEIHTLYHMTEADDVLFDLPDLSPQWHYLALGHVHKAQTVGAASHVRYSGSLDRLDFGEMHDGHGVLLVEIGRRGVVGEPQTLPIPATPFHDVSLTDPAVELPALAERYPEAERQRAIFRVTVTPAAAGPSRDEVNRELRRLFPRLHELRWAEADGEDDEGRPTFTPRAGFGSTVREYLGLRLQNDPDREELLALAETFLRAEGEA